MFSVLTTVITSSTTSRVNPAGQQMAIDQVARLLDRVAALREQVQIVAGQFLPVETQARDRGQPIQNVGPGLTAKIETHPTIGARADLQFGRVRGIGRMA
jgi:hypothetical protein